MRRIKALHQRGISGSAVLLLFFAGFISLCITGYAATPLEVIWENIPDDIQIRRDDGTVDTISFKEALVYHDADEHQEAAENGEEREPHMCFGVTTAFLAIQYVTGELFGEEIPEADDLEFTVAGHMKGAMDTFELYLGRSAKTRNIAFGPDAFTFTAIRMSTGESITFGYDFNVLNPEFDDFIALKKAGKGCDDPEFANVKHTLIGKVLLAGSGSCFVNVQEEGTFGLEEEPSVRGFLVISHGFTMEWNNMVCEAMSELTRDENELYEICFLEDFIGDGMGYKAPQEAYETLVERGVTEIIGIPVFIDSNSNHITEVRYVLGLEEMDEPEEALVEARIQGDVPIAGLTSAIDGHPIVGEAFARMILDADDPAKENRAVLIAHGPNTDTEEEKWVANLESLYEVLVSDLPPDFFIEHQLMTLRVLNFPYFPERLTELGVKLKDFAGKGEVFLLYLHISPGYLDMIVQGLPLDSISHVIFPGCLDELTLDELANVVHLSTGLCEMGILPAIVRARAEEWMIGEDAGVHTAGALTEEA